MEANYLIRIAEDELDRLGIELRTGFGRSLVDLLDDVHVANKDGLGINQLLDDHLPLSKTAAFFVERLLLLRAQAFSASCIVPLNTSRIARGRRGRAGRGGRRGGGRR